MSEEVKIKTEFNVTAGSKENLIQKIVDKGIEISAIQSDSKDEIYQAFLKREEQGTTGLVDGYAIPHAESTAINHPALLIYKLKESIEWESMDGKPVNFVFGILVPTKQKGTAHLKILSEIAKMLMKKDAKDQLASADSEESIMRTIKNYTSID